MENNFNARIKPQHIADSTKAALGIGNLPLKSYCFVVTQANHYIVPYGQIPKAQLPIPNAENNFY